MGMRGWIRAKKIPPEGRQYKIGTRSAVGNNNHTMLETRKWSHNGIGKDTARQRENQEPENRMQVGTKKESGRLVSKISWQGIGAEIGKGSGKGKHEAVGEFSGRTGVLEGTRARHTPCHGCRNARTGGTGRTIEKQRKTDLGLSKETGEEIGSDCTRRLRVG